MTRRQSKAGHLPSRTASGAPEGSVRESMVFAALAVGELIVPPVPMQPTVRLFRWLVVAFPDGARHLVGRHDPAHEDRVSTPVKHVEPGKRLAITLSGRRYELVGPPGTRRDGRWIERIWLRARGLTLADVKLVTGKQAMLWLQSPPATLRDRSA